MTQPISKQYVKGTIVEISRPKLKGKHRVRTRVIRGITRVATYGFVLASLFQLTGTLQI